jgi:hypothetical protein
MTTRFVVKDEVRHITLAIENLENGHGLYRSGQSFHREFNMTFCQGFNQADTEFFRKELLLHMYDLRREYSSKE